MWLDHISRVIARACEYGELVFVGGVDSGKVWASVRRAISRAQGEFVRVAVRNGSPVVVATVAFHGSVELDAVDAVEAAAAALLNAPITIGMSQKVVSASLNWSLHERRPPSEFVLCGRIPEQHWYGVRKVITAGNRGDSIKEGRS